MGTVIDRAIAQITPELVQEMQRLIASHPGSDASYVEMVYSLDHDELPGVGLHDPDTREAVIGEIYRRASSLLSETTRDTAGLGPLPAIARPELAPVEAAPLYEGESADPEIEAYVRDRIDTALRRAGFNPEDVTADVTIGLSVDESGRVFSVMTAVGDAISEDGDLSADRLRGILGRAFPTGLRLPRELASRLSEDSSFQYDIALGHPLTRTEPGSHDALLEEIPSEPSRGELIVNGLTNGDGEPAPYSREFQDVVVVPRGVGLPEEFSRRGYVRVPYGGSYRPGCGFLLYAPSHEEASDIVGSLYHTQGVGSAAETLRFGAYEE